MLKKIIKERRSIRKFKRKKIPRKMIYELVDAAQWAPSACNKQLCRYIIIDDERIKNELVKKTGTPIIKNAPCVIAVLYRSDFSFQHHANIQSAAAAIQNMLLMAHSLGLGAVWVSGLGNRKKIRDILRIPDNYLICAFVALGFPDERPSPPSRKNVDEILSFNKFVENEKIGYPALYDPEAWTLTQIKNYRDDCIRATSPTPDVFPYGMEAEFKKEIDIVLKYMKPGRKILEILPFAGTHILNILKNNDIKDCYVWEWSPGVVDFLMKRKDEMKIKTKINPVIKFSTSIPFEDRSLDTVLCFQKLETIPNGLNLIKEVSRILKLDGNFILSFRNLSSLYGVFYYFEYTRPVKKGKKDAWNYGPFKPLKCSCVLKELKNSGFSIEGIQGISLLPKINTKSFLCRYSKMIVLKCRKVM